MPLRLDVQYVAALQKRGREGGRGMGGSCASVRDERLGNERGMEGRGGMRGMEGRGPVHLLTMY